MTSAQTAPWTWYVTSKHWRRR